MRAPVSYTRMFPQLARPGSKPNSELERGLEKLGRIMTDDDKPPEGRLPAGYTYLGQFIDHDLTLDLTPLDDAHPCVERIPNFRSPFLDLDQIYGGGPNLSPFLYRNEYKDRGKERFLIGPDWKKGLEYDLPRNAEGIALIGDPRDDENLIVAQLHVAFLKYHNCVIEGLNKGKNGQIESAGPAQATLFEQARRLVTWHYQYIIVNDFLGSLIDPGVFKGLGLDQFIPNESKVESFSIPVEFSAAAFRFGHSMVRSKYPYNTVQGEVSLYDLLIHTGVGGGATPSLPRDWVIDWVKFFSISKPPRPVRKIDTKLADALHNLEHPTLRLFSLPGGKPPRNPLRNQAAPEKVLPVRTLWRGARMGLPSGQDIAKAMGLKPLEPSEIAPNSGPHTDVLRSYGFDEDTPLWYYILKEAELAPHSGNRLGPVGSWIVADVILKALHADGKSYLSIDPKWKPELPTKSADEMGKIVQFINTRQPL
jgi:Animal haem peroxidase